MRGEKEGILILSFSFRPTESETVTNSQLGKGREGRGLDFLFPFSGIPAISEGAIGERASLPPPQCDRRTTIHVKNRDCGRKTKHLAKSTVHIGLCFQCFRNGWLTELEEYFFSSFLINFRQVCGLWRISLIDAAIMNSNRFIYELNVPNNQNIFFPSMTNLRNNETFKLTVDKKTATARNGRKKRPFRIQNSEKWPRPCMWESTCVHAKKEKRIRYLAGIIRVGPRSGKKATVSVVVM